MQPRRGEAAAEDSGEGAISDNVELPPGLMFPLRVDVTAGQLLSIFCGTNKIIIRDFGREMNARRRCVRARAVLLGRL